MALITVHESNTTLLHFNGDVYRVSGGGTQPPEYWSIRADTQGGSITAVAASDVTTFTPPSNPDGTKIVYAVDINALAVRIFYGIENSCQQDFYLTGIYTIDPPPLQLEEYPGNYSPSGYTTYNYLHPGTTAMVPHTVICGSSLPCLEDLADDTYYYVYAGSHGNCNIPAFKFMLFSGAGGTNSVYPIDLGPNYAVDGPRQLYIGGGEPIINADPAQHWIVAPSDTDYNDDLLIALLSNSGNYVLTPGNYNVGGGGNCFLPRWEYGGAVYPTATALTYKSLECQTGTIGSNVGTATLDHPLPTCYTYQQNAWDYDNSGDMIFHWNYLANANGEPAIARGLLPAGTTDNIPIYLTDQSIPLYVDQENLEVIIFNESTSMAYYCTSGTIDPETCVATLGIINSVLIDEWLPFCPYEVVKYPLVEGEPCGDPGTDNTVYWQGAEGGGAGFVNVWVPENIPGVNAGTHYDRFYLVHPAPNGALPDYDQSNHPPSAAYSHFANETEIYVYVNNDVTVLPPKPYPYGAEPTGTLLVTVNPGLTYASFHALYNYAPSSFHFWSSNNNTKSLVRQGQASDCVATGHWECPGNGQPAVWVGTLPDDGNPPDCTGSYSCPGNGQPAVWSNPSVTEYGTIPDCTGEWSPCPGNGQPCTWSNPSVAPYLPEPDCTGEWSPCPGNGQPCTWSNPSVAPYLPEPDCTGTWDCIQGTSTPQWSNPSVTPYGTQPDCTESEEEEQPAVEEGLEVCERFCKFSCGTPTQLVTLQSVPCPAGDFTLLHELATDMDRGTVDLIIANVSDTSDDNVNVYVSESDTPEVWDVIATNIDIKAVTTKRISNIRVNADSKVFCRSTGGNIYARSAAKELPLGEFAWTSCTCAGVLPMDAASTVENFTGPGLADLYTPPATSEYGYVDLVVSNASESDAIVGVVALDSANPASPAILFARVIRGGDTVHERGILIKGTEDIKASSSVGGVTISLTTREYEIIPIDDGEDE